MRISDWSSDVCSSDLLLFQRTAICLVPDRLAAILDVVDPGLFDELDDAVRHRHVVEIAGHLVAILERPVEELQRDQRVSSFCRLVVHDDEGDRKSVVTGTSGQYG